MIDLSTQLHDYFDEIVEHVKYDDLSVAPVSVGLEGDAPARRHRPGWAVALATTVAVLILGGVVAAVVSWGTDEPPVITQPDEPPVITQPEPTPTTLPEPTPVEVSWREVDWGLRSVHSPPVYLGGSDVLFRSDRDGRLLSSGDGDTWEPVFADLTGVSIAVDGPMAVATWTLNDGTSALFISDDGETWSEVDHSTLPETEQLEVIETTRSGLTWFRTARTVERGHDILAVIANDQLIDVHVPPWDTEGSGTLNTDLVETTSGIAAIQAQFNSPKFSYAWSYQGSGQWSQPVEIPISYQHLRVGDTILMIDHTAATCCGNSILGESLWPVLASNDGINWTEVSSLAASTAYPLVSGGSDGVHALSLIAGESFWVYGPQISGGDFGIDYDASTTLWISTDGTNWQPLDVEINPPPLAAGGPRFTNRDRFSVRAAGDFIFIYYPDVGGIATIRWVGEVKLG